MLLRKFFIATVSLLGACWISGCSTNHAEPSLSKASGDTLFLSAEMNARVPVTIVSEQAGRSEISLSGRVDFDPTSVTHVYPLVSGVYDRIYVQQGAHVTRGQVLATVYSPDLATAMSDFHKAQSSLLQAQRNLERDRQLFARDLEAKQDLETSESTVSLAVAEFDRARHSLKILGGAEDEDDIKPLYQITAPISGLVVESFAQPGAQVRNDGSTIAFTVGNTNSLWIALDAYPDQLQRIADGDTVLLHAAGLEDRPFYTTVDYINTVVDPTSFTTKVRCKLPNESGLLRPMMFVSATVYHEAGRGLYIPAAAAFVDANGNYYAFAKRGERRYVKVPITVGKSNASRDEVVSGLANGDTIAADKALFLNDELASDQK